jgi:2-polyprenyl-3-methyl-5-hydroxy-6-metoxy-1,4-benzoquinol methylase
MESILDFGCGPGYLLDHLLKFKGLKGKLYALEFSKESIHQVNMKFSNHPHFGRAEYIQNLPCSFEDHSMDVVISIEVVEHLTDGQLRGTFKEFYRMLKPGGYAVITTPHNENLDLNKTICPECGLVFHRWQHIKTWTPQSLKNILSESGFKIELVQATYFQSARARWLNRILRIGTLSFKRPDSQLPHLIAIVKKNA